MLYSIDRNPVVFPPGLAKLLINPLLSVPEHVRVSLEVEAGFRPGTLHRLGEAGCRGQRALADDSTAPPNDFQSLPPRQSPAVKAYYRGAARRLRR
jgi:hypothetical protein